MPATPLTVLVARRDVAAAHAAVSLLGAQGFDVLPPVTDGQDALRAILLHQPAAAILGCDLPGLSSNELLERLLDSAIPTHCIVHTRNPEPTAALDAFRLGALGYLPCEAEPDEFLACLRTVLRGELYLSPTLLGGLVEITLRALQAELPPYRGLSRRELEVFKLIGQGLVSRQIATRLVPQVGEDTVETYRRRIRDKLGIMGGGNALLQEAIAYAKKNGGGWGGGVEVSDLQIVIL